MEHLMLVSLPSISPGGLSPSQQFYEVDFLSILQMKIWNFRMLRELLQSHN